MKVIAEVGSNFKELEHCEKSIQIAKQSGADVVKFQFYTHQDLYGFGGQLECLPNVAYLSSVAKSVGIEFMCTAFSVAGFDYVDQYVNTHKIASAECTDINILRHVNSYKKPVILSTGGATLAEIDFALHLLKDCPVTILYCVADYPAKIIDFRQLDLLKEKFGPRYSYGYSDHSTDVLIIPKIAKERGATVLEKHVNLVNVSGTPDAPHSINEAELRLMCTNLKQEIPLSVIQSETNQEMESQWKRRFVAYEKIREGQNIYLGKNVGIFRSKACSFQSIPTYYYNKIEGSRATRDIKPGQVIEFNDVVLNG